MNNAVYSKTMEYFRNRAYVGLANDENDYLKRVLKPSYLEQKMFDNNFAVIQKIKTPLTLKKYI